MSLNSSKMCHMFVFSNMIIREGERKKEAALLLGGHKTNRASYSRFTNSMLLQRLMTSRLNSTLAIALTITAHRNMKKP